MIWFTLMAPAVAATASKLEAAYEQYRSVARFPCPALDREQFDALVDGRIVRFRYKGEGDEDSAFGIMLTDQPIQRTWLGSLDPHYTVKSGLVEDRLQVRRTGAVWFGQLNLPFPFKDRNWIVETRSNSQLVRVSDNQSWERSWDLREDLMSGVLKRARTGDVVGLSHKDITTAVFTPVNRGAYLFLQVGEQSLLGYYSTAVVGGTIPDNLVNQFVLMGLDEVLQGVVDRAGGRVLEHYVSPHEEIFGGDDKVLPYYKGGQVKTRP